MKFNFLSPKLHYKESDFNPDIINKIYEMCREYAIFIESCRQIYLTNHPDVDPNSDDFSFPIHYHKIEHTFPEGKLWHGDADWYQESNKVIHSLFLDIQNDDTTYYSFSVEELSPTEFIMLNIERIVDDE